MMTMCEITTDHVNVSEEFSMSKFDSKTSRELAMLDCITALRAELATLNKFPPKELTWLYSHCKAIGMTCESESGKWEHDIALFTIDLQQEVLNLQKQLNEKQVQIDELIIEYYPKEIQKLKSQLAAHAMVPAFDRLARNEPPMGNE